MITTQIVSTYRKKLRLLIQEIEHLAFQCAYTDPLIRGSPGEVFRTCGKKSCKCSQGGAYRHGPYLVIQTFEKGKQKQVSLKKSERALWEQAKNYQFHKNNLVKLKTSTNQLNRLASEIMEQRIEMLKK